MKSWKTWRGSRSIHKHPILKNNLVKEIARMVNLSVKLGYRLEAEGRHLTKEEACIQLGHSASLFKAILLYVTEGGTYEDRSHLRQPKKELKGLPAL